MLIFCLFVKIELSSLKGELQKQREAALGGQVDAKTQIDAIIASHAAGKQ
jgi:hypothetical protein